MGRPTQREIARRLGLSPATVSLALRDSPMIADATRELVRRAVAEAGYVPNVAASALRTGRTRIVGVSFHNIAHQFFAEMLIAIEDALAEDGVAVFVNNHDEDPELLARFVTSIASHGAEALIVAPPPFCAPEMFGPLRAQGAPVIYVGRHIPGDDAADRVINADALAMERAVGRLVETGRRRIVLLGGAPGTSVADARAEGFRRAVEAAGLGWSDAQWVSFRPRLLEGADGLRQAMSMDPRPDGVVCFNDLVAIGALNALWRLGLTPGRDVGVVGVGGTEEAAALFPALTAVSDNPARIGRQAAEILRERLADPSAPPRHVTLDPVLVIRESCGGA